MAFLNDTPAHGAGGFRPYFLRWPVRLVLALCFLIPVPETRGEAAKDYDLKAVFLFNFAQFVDWPPKAFSDPDSPIVIGVLGEDPFGKSLDEVVRNEEVRGRKLIVKRYRRIEEIDSCHILFISASKSNELASILARVREKPILTVGESEGFAANGGMVRFLTDQNKIRFRINKEAAKAAGLTVSSKLLKAAHEIVESSPP